MEENERGKQSEEETWEQEVLSWGAGTEGQLGTGKLQDEEQPHLLHSLSSFGPITHLFCGGAHVIALIPGGRVLTWGRGTSGQLGHGEMANSLCPKIVESLLGFVITHVSAGWNHSGFVSDAGRLFTCGDGSFGQLGHGDNTSQCSPEEVTFFNSGHVEQIACGMHHSLALLKGHCGNQVYGFGSGKRGQLGISSDKVKSMNHPRTTLGLEDVNIISISANGDHSAAICANGHLYTWGRAFHGSSDFYKPQRVTSSLSCSQVALGWNHALSLTDDGKVFMLGGHRCVAHRNPQKLTGDTSGSTVEEDLMRRVPLSDGERITQIAAGAEHSALVTEKGSVMTWGWGEHGQLGLGNTMDQSEPQVVSLGHKLDMKKDVFCKVYCGSGFTFAIRSRN